MNWWRSNRLLAKDREWSPSVHPLHLVNRRHTWLVKKCDNKDKTVNVIKVMPESKTGPRFTAKPATKTVMDSNGGATPADTWWLKGVKHSKEQLFVYWSKTFYQLYSWELKAQQIFHCWRSRIKEHEWTKSYCWSKSTNWCGRKGFSVSFGVTNSKVWRGHSMNHSHHLMLCLYDNTSTDIIIVQDWSAFSLRYRLTSNG